MVKAIPVARSGRLSHKVLEPVTTFLLKLDQACGLAYREQDVEFEHRPVTLIPKSRHRCLYSRDPTWTASKTPYPVSQRPIRPTSNAAENPKPNRRPSNSIQWQTNTIMFLSNRSFQENRELLG
eukprot:scaffold12169_cov132-Cylindrotheca_fusiformis.AAC.14